MACAVIVGSPDEPSSPLHGFGADDGDDDDDDADDDESAPVVSCAKAGAADVIRPVTTAARIAVERNCPMRIPFHPIAYG
jgi:hypothetical protein